MPDLGFNLVDSEPCQTGPSHYHARAWFWQPESRTFRVITKDLGKKRLDTKNSAAQIERFTKVVAANMLPRLVGFSVLNLCENSSHSNGQRLERLGSFAVVGVKYFSHDISRSSLVVGDEGVGSALALDPALGQLERVVDLSKTFKESQLHPASHLARAIASGVGSAVFVAMRPGLVMAISL